MVALLDLITLKLNPFYRCDLNLDSGLRSNVHLGVVYGSIAFFLSILHNIFVLYHVDTFVTVYKISKTSFWIGESIFLVWNCINDPLFGWLSDADYLNKKRGRWRRSSASGGAESTNASQSTTRVRRRRSSEDFGRVPSELTEEFDKEVVLRRVRALTWSGPGLAIAFALLWTRWSRPEVQFAFCLCIYDGFLTLVDLHHSALLADLEVAHAERTTLNSWCSFFSALASVSVFTSYLFWNRDHISKFRHFCHALALISLIGFFTSCFVFRGLIRIKTIESSVSGLEDDETERETDHARDHLLPNQFEGETVLPKSSPTSSLSPPTDRLIDDRFSHGSAFNPSMFDAFALRFCLSRERFPFLSIFSSSANSATKSPSSSSSFLRFLGQLVRQRNFLWFSAMNVLQCFHCHFNSNFFPLFLDSLLQNRLSSRACSLLLGLSFVIPHLNNLYFMSLCRRFGTYAVIKKLFLLKVGLGVAMLLFSGPDHTWMLCAYLACNRVFTEGTCKLLTLVITDLVDEDVVLNERRRGVSALIFGTAAFLSKPGQTLAPLLGTALIAAETGKEVFAGEGFWTDASSAEMDGSSDRSAIFRILIYLPVVVAVVQLICWSKFSLHGSRLSEIKRRRKEGISGNRDDVFV